MMTSDSPPQQYTNKLFSGGLAPLRSALYRNLWLASVASNIGTWIHDIGASWVMVSLNPSPLWTSLIQTAAMLPMFLLAIPAGALSDILDRRHILLSAQVWMGLSAIVLTYLAWSQTVTIESLLLITFLLGMGNAFSGPAWQAIIPDIVSKEDLSSAVALQGIGINAARSIGPAIGGFIIGSIGTYAAFFLNALSYLGIILVLSQWKTKPEVPGGKAPLPKEHFWLAIQSGIRYVRFSRPFQSVLVRAVGFILFACSIWALLPIFVKHVLHMDATFLGGVMACIGVGAILGAFSLPYINKVLSTDQQLILGGTLFGFCLILFPWAHNTLVFLTLMVLAGLAWTLNLAKLNVSAQHTLPDWVRARGLSVYLVAFFGCMAFGSLGWGWVAEQLSITHAWTIAGVGLVLAQFLALKFKLSNVHALNLAPSQYWPMLMGACEQYRLQPVLISITYHINKEDKGNFLAALDQLRITRYQTGAIRWEVFNDIDQSGQMIEQFLVPSWEVHQLQHERVTEDDKKIQEAVHAYHQGNKPPHVNHWWQN